MAIQIPRIQEDPQAAEPAPSARLDAPRLDTATPMKEQQAAVESVGKEVIRYHDQKATQEADNIATEADNKFQDWHRKQLYGDPSTGATGLLHQEGDPQVNYEKFNKEAQEKLDELSAAPEGQNWEGLTQNVVNRRLNKRAEELHNESLTTYGKTKYDYDKQTMAVSVDFAQKAMPGISAMVDPAHPETFGPLQSKLDDIQRPIIQNALKYGGAVQTEDGSTVLTPIVKQQIAKAVSTGLYNTIDNLYNSDQGDGEMIKKADAIREQFADKLDPFHKDSLLNKGHDSLIKQKSLQLAQIIEQKGTSAPEVLHAPLEIRQQAMKMAKDYTYDMQAMKDMKQKQNADVALKHIDEIQNSDQPYTSTTALKNDPVVLRVWDHMSAQQQQALEHMVTAPKETSDQALSNWLDLKTGQRTDGKTLDTISKTELLSGLGGMSAADRRNAIKDWTAHQTATGPQQVAFSNQIAKELKNQAIGGGLVHNVPNSNLLTSEDQVKYPNLLKELTDNIDLNHRMNPKELSSYVAQFVADKVAGHAFKPPSRTTFNGSAVKTPPSAGAPNPPPNALPGAASTAPLKGAAAIWGGLKDSAKVSWIIRYKKANKGMTPKTDELMKFIDDEERK